MGCFETKEIFTLKKKTKKNVFTQKEVNRQFFYNTVTLHKVNHIDIIIKWMRALWLVNQLWFIVPLNSNSNFKFRVSSELLYKSNRPHVFMVYRLINHLGCWKNTRSIRKSLACSSWFTNSSRLLPTSHVAYYPINHKNLWSIDQLSAGNALPSCTHSILHTVAHFDRVPLNHMWKAGTKSAIVLESTYFL